MVNPDNETPLYKLTQQVTHKFPLRLTSLATLTSQFSAKNTFLESLEKNWAHKIFLIGIEGIYLWSISWCYFGMETSPHWNRGPKINGIYWNLLFFEYKHYQFILGQRQMGLGRSPSRVWALKWGPEGEVEHCKGWGLLRKRLARSHSNNKLHIFDTFYVIF